MIKVEIYTDGACNQQKKIGGWSFVLLENGEEKISKNGKEEETTNNKCEMLAAIKAFEELDSIEFFQSFTVTVYSDSAYIVNAFKEDWISGWLLNGWLNAEKKPVANKEYWEALISYQKKYKVDFVHIKRRSNHLAEKVDNLANLAKNSLH